MTQKPDVILFLSDARGQYIPRDFAQSIKRTCLSGVTDEDMQTLLNGPEDEWYWEAWDNVCRGAIITDENGVTFFIHQDGDCWLIPSGMEWKDGEDFFSWPTDKTEED